MEQQHRYTSTAREAAASTLGRVLKRIQILVVISGNRRKGQIAGEPNSHDCQDRARRPASRAHSGIVMRASVCVAAQDPTRLKVHGKR